MAEQKATETAEAVEIETHLVNEATVGDNLEGKKIAKDGRTVLSPQPSDDPEDPLNWSWARKHRVLLALILPSLLGDAGMAWGATLFEAQAETWNISVSKASTSLNWGIFLQGPGGLLIVPLIQRYGRLPLEFWSQFLTSCILIGAATSPTFVSFTALRSIQGILGVAPNVIGLSIIHDMFFFHERARKINIWTLCLATGPCLGSFISGLLIEIISWRACFGVLAGIYGLSALLVVFLGDETLYDRGESDPQPSGKGFVNKFLLLTGIAGARATGRPGTWTVIKDLSSLFILPQLLVPGRFRLL
ncbi:MAG: hypothetical protein M1834_006449 [Cirrosporium novae-zelandiae]|nr:MAG: hypothetical protein M1834_006449 [Cirrosporium novae-zelandiae]